MTCLSPEAQRTSEGQSNLAVIKAVVFGLKQASTPPINIVCLLEECVVKGLKSRIGVRKLTSTKTQSKRERETDRQTDRDRERETERQTDRQTDREKSAGGD